MMIKHTAFVKFRPELERAEADRRWADEVGPLELVLPGLERYVQNTVVITTTNEGAVAGPPGFDGMTSMWFTDMGAFDAALDSSEWAAAQRCAGAIFDPGWRGGGASAEIEERVRRVGMGARVDGISTPPGDPIKLVGLLRYREDLTRENANNYWRTTPGRIALRIGAMGHYVQNHAIRGTGGRGVPAFDGFSEAWFADFESYERSMASPEWSDLVADGPELFDMSVFVSGIVRERVLKELRP
ncbi:MAG: EthD domain-containing protein [Actinobacteria bacterium]|nr:EthD domain-containing protein [Actinomycetota bacterium]